MSGVAEATSLYDDCCAHYESCSVAGRNIADTWVHTLNRKGARYSHDEMAQMRRPGSFVTLHINIFDYFVDSERVDRNDSVLSKILAAGESPIGEPLKDVSVAGLKFSSVYLKHVSIAANIIRNIERRNISSPVLLEIGGGCGLLLAALRHYFGNRLTIIAADIPETLFYQEYYLRASFPDVPTTFRPGAGAIPLKRGGFNFVNAYSLADMSYAFDIAVNNNSMQEMTGDVAADYIRYIENNINPNGFFYFRNSFGHALKSIQEPSEYPLDPYWKLTDADFGDYYTDSSATPFVSFVFDRCTAPQNQKHRTLQQRIFWNGFHAGLLRPRAQLSNRILALDTSSTVEADYFARSLKDAIASAPHGKSRDWITELQSSPVLNSAFYSVERSSKDRRVKLWQLQDGLIKRMEEASGRPAKDTKIAVCEFCEEQLREASPVILGSEYWTAAFAGIGIAVGTISQALALIDKISKTDNQYWKLRFAWLAREAGAIDVSRAIFKTFSDQLIDIFWLPMAAVLAERLGDHSRALHLFSEACRGIDNDASGELPATIARIAISLGWISDAETMLRKIRRNGATEPDRRQLELALSLARSNPDESERAMFWAKQTTFAPQSSAYAELLYRTGAEAEGLEVLLQCERRNGDSYYALAGIARTYLSLSQRQAAIRCMDRSVALRPNNIRHLEFLGLSCFEAEVWDGAARWLGDLLRLCPYDRVTHGLSAYARLSDATRNTAIFGWPRHQPIIFQKYQRFYYHEGPQIR